MFSRKKRNYTWIYVCAALILGIIAVFALICTLAGAGGEESLQANLESKAIEEEQREQAQPPAVSKESETENRPEESAEENQFYQSYYLVKFDSNIIKIFFSDETGNLVELEETGIVYETLTVDDQKRFREGVKADTREDLNRLLMNYES